MTHVVVFTTAEVTAGSRGEVLHRSHGDVADHRYGTTESAETAAVVIRPELRSVHRDIYSRCMSMLELRVVNDSMTVGSEHAVKHVANRT